MSSPRAGTGTRSALTLGTTGRSKLASKNEKEVTFKNQSGNGDSEGMFEFGNYAVEAQDIRAAVQFIRDSGSKVSGLVGHSKGAGSVLLYSSKYDDIPNVVNVAGRFDMCTGVKERFGENIIERLSSEKQIAMKIKRDDGKTIEWMLTKWSLQDRLDLNMAVVASKICMSEVLTIHGTDDAVIPVSDANKWQQHIKSHHLCLIGGADHGFKKPEHAKEMIDALAHHCCH